VYPALSAAAVMPATTSFLYLGRANSIEERLAQYAQMRFQPIQAGQVRGLVPWRAAQNLGQVYQTIGRVRAIIRDFQPTAIFVTGGYVSAPVIWAGAAEKIPSVIYLPDLEPGWAIRATARWATRVAVSFVQVEKHFARGKAVTTGYPVRAAFYQTNRVEARKRFHLDPNLRTLAIFGGSSGAHHINKVAVENLVRLTQTAQVILLTGRQDEAWANDAVVQLLPALRARVRVFGYLDEDLPHALAAADLVVARAGAATLGEFPALGLPAILVPYPYAGNHQQQNAEFLARHGGAVIVPDAALETDLLPTIEKIFGAPEQLKAMREAMRGLAQPLAAENIAALLQSLELK
jgi:UDP-N-acetylglucosamine--N-acetylmuramyl-(pentapeptide) pyrophosphoryl-undecaprenol N-acetylglucosamine transferase